MPALPRDGLQKKLPQPRLARISILLNVGLRLFAKSIMTIRKYTLRIEPWWTLVFAPLIQEFIFRFVPYKFLYVGTEQFWAIAFATAFAFALIHWYFRVWFVFYSFAWGLVLWWIMVSSGFVAVVLVHSILNFFHMRLNLLTPKIEQ